MLECAAGSLANKRINHVLLSAHSQDIHRSFVKKVVSFTCRVEVASDFDSETTSHDGFVFAANPSLKPVFTDFSPLSRLQILEVSPAMQVQYIAKRIARPGYSGPVWHQDQEDGSRGILLR
jgi:hypothetical protein